MDRLISIHTAENIPPVYHNTPIGLLLEYHNLNRPLDRYTKACLLIGMCIDNRKHLRVPKNFGFTIRSAGANLKEFEFNVSYAIAVGEVNSIALIGHSNCGMVDLTSKKDQFIHGLVEKAGWEPVDAEDHFLHNLPSYELRNVIDFTLSEVIRLRQAYQNIQVAPMYYKVEDNLLYLIREGVRT